MHCGPAHAAADCTTAGICLQVQSFDQKFENMNKALLLSCQKGMPVRVVRSHKVKLIVLRTRLQSWISAAKTCRHA